MARESVVTVSAPGTFMLLGEHAVLHGRRALVAATNRRLRVQLAPRADRRVHVRSALGEMDMDLEDLIPSKPFEFALSALQGSSGRLKTGLVIDIESDFPPTIGLGSSAAVTAAIVRGVDAVMGTTRTLQALHAECFSAVRRVQGTGSGADLAACLAGGVVSYRFQPYQQNSLEGLPPIALVYSGRKTSTPDVIRWVEDRRRHDPAGVERVFDAMDDSIGPAMEAINRGDWVVLGHILDENQAHMEKLGVTNPELDDIVHRLRRLSGVTGAKISGAGLGDCVVAIGDAEGFDGPYEVIPATISAEGVVVE